MLLPLSWLPGVPGVERACIRVFQLLYCRNRLIRAGTLHELLYCRNRLIKSGLIPEKLYCRYILIRAGLIPEKLYCRYILIRAGLILEQPFTVLFVVCDHIYDLYVNI